MASAAATADDSSDTFLISAGEEALLEALGLLSPVSRLAEYSGCGAEGRPKAPQTLGPPFDALPPQLGGWA
eukprot:9298903-Pyramimonas_sp.AAC.1